MDSPAQTLDLNFAQQSLDWVHNTQIAPDKVHKAWTLDQSLDCLDTYPTLGLHLIKCAKCGLKVSFHKANWKKESGVLACLLYSLSWH